MPQISSLGYVQRNSHLKVAVVLPAETGRLRKILRARHDCQLICVDAMIMLLRSPGLPHWAIADALMKNETEQWPTVQINLRPCRHGYKTLLCYCNFIGCRESYTLPSTWMCRGCHIPSQNSAAQSVEYDLTSQHGGRGRDTVLMYPVIID